MNLRLDRNGLEKLRHAKRSRNFYRLVSPLTIEHEFRRQFGHPSSYAFVRFECNPADDLSFEARVSWPSTVPEHYQPALARAVAEGVADVLLDGLYQHTGCAVALVEVRYDEIGSSEAAFMTAAKSAMQELLTREWKIIIRPREQNGSYLT